MKFVVPGVSRILFLLILLILSLSPVANAAQWTALGENEFGTFYVDKATVTQAQDVIQVDTMLNWVEPHPLTGNEEKTYFSEVALAYLDCKKKELAFGTRTMYADADARGRIVFRIELGQNEVRLRPFSAGSTGEQLMRSVCPKQPNPR